MMTSSHSSPTTLDLDKDTYRKAFHFYDTNGSGSLSVDEILHLTSLLWQSFNPNTQELDDEIKLELQEQIALHAEGKHEMTLEEFIPFYRHMEVHMEERRKQRHTLGTKIHYTNKVKINVPQADNFRKVHAEQEADLSWSLKAKVEVIHVTLSSFTGNNQGKEYELRRHMSYSSEPEIFIQFHKKICSNLQDIEAIMKSAQEGHIDVNTSQISASPLSPWLIATPRSLVSPRSTLHDAIYTHALVVGLVDVLVKLLDVWESTAAESVKHQKCGDALGKEQRFLWHQTLELTTDGLLRLSESSQCVARMMQVIRVCVWTVVVLIAAAAAAAAR